jgi:serine/threonine protein kinase
MKRSFKPLTSFATSVIAWLCLLVWIFGMAGHSMAADSILPDIPQIDWRDLTQGKLIGRGGFGDVYEGQWKGQDVAIKRLHMHTLSTEVIKRDFDAEVRVMWNSQYPQILRLYGVTGAGDCAMVMERMQRSLHDLIHSEEEIPDAKRLQIAIDIAQGLASLHGQKIVHRDLKSQNILLDKRNRGKISDFGLAKIRIHTQSFTRGALGTVRWSAPEVFGLKPRTTPASDMYSYGMILWELVTRKVPFAEQPNDIMILAAVQTGAREDIPDGCHPVWQEMIKECWEQDPEKRPTAPDALARFMSLKPPHRPLWLPEEDSQSPLRAEGYVRQLASQGDWDLVLRSYAHHPVPGYDIGRVEVIFNPSMNVAFEARCKHLQQRQGNPRYAALWQQTPDGGARAEVARRLEDLADPWQDDDYPDVKLMPLWHGTQRDKLGSLLSAGYGAFGDTDDGYFGKGIYATFEAAYAQKYADNFGPPDLRNGVLIFNWGVTYNSRPLIKSDFNQHSKRLNWAPDTAKYDSHFVPVVPLTQVDYVPVLPLEPHQFTEVIFFDASQLLPRYLVTLQPSLPNSPAIPLIAQGHEAIYQRFLNGALIYRPTERSDAGMVRLPIRDLVNPLEGTFDLSRCGDTGDWLSIATGYKKGKKPESARKVEIWIALRFLIEKELDSTAGQFKDIMKYWKPRVPVGLLWTWGDDDVRRDNFDYLVSQDMGHISNGENLLIKSMATLPVGRQRDDGAYEFKLGYLASKSGVRGDCGESFYVLFVSAT